MMNQSDNFTRSGKKKATNRDVAKFAGVSVATVSYVINGRTDQRISEATRKKVLQAANYLNYSPNPYAVGLNTTRAQSIVVRSSANASLLTELEIACFLRDFSKICFRDDFLLSYSADKRPVKIAASVCICMGMSKAEFHALCDENFIPVIALDGLIDDPVFYQINADYPKMRKDLEERIGDVFSYVALSNENEDLKSAVTDIMPRASFVSSIAECVRAFDTPHTVAVSQPSLAALAKELGAENVFFYSDYAERRLPCLIKTARNAIDRISVTDAEHFVTI